LTVAGKFPAKDLVAYIGAQLVGAVIASVVLYLIARGAPGFDLSQGFATNGYGAHSPGGYSLSAAMLCEVVMTCMFVLVILGATSDEAPKGFAPLAIGLTLTAIHLVSIPVTNTSVNPARSTGPALIAGGWALGELWLFWLAPLAGAAIAGVAYRAFQRIGVPGESGRPVTGRPMGSART
jgi:aquaporin Z